MKKAMISSTARDLPDHRRMVMDACLRMGFQPIMMEHLPGQDRSAADVSVGMVEDADVYLGVFAHAYGSRPDGDPRSYTEIELDKAASLGLVVLPFFMHDDHLWKASLVDKGENAEKLERLKQKIAKDRIVPRYMSPEDLRGLVIHALSEFEKSQARPGSGLAAPSFHPPSHIPAAPARYVAHPYTLLQTAAVVGRRDELKLLTDWVTRNEQVPRDIRVFCVVALGGMGKSALTWKWFEDIAPNELPTLAGRMWWSFYESDAHFENFVLRALAYTAGMPEAEVRALPSPERQDRLLRLLDERPFLLVLDGLERILLAYARMDAAHLADDDLDQQTANSIADAHGVPDDVKETYLEKHRLRQCADLRAGAFLRRLTRVRASRVLISTRLYPAELQTHTAAPLPGCYAQFLRGLADDDALALWRGFIGGERSGTSEQLLALFRTFDSYPLLLRALAGEVATYRPAPGDFERWRRDHPRFDPAGLPLKNAKTHVLEFALRGLAQTQRRVLHTLAAFRMPATWQTLCALLTGAGKPCADESALDAVLTELEDRGLVGWDKRANRYDLHPIVRGIVWSALDLSSKRDVYGELHTYFDAAPRPPAWDKVEGLEDLTPAVELFDKLISLERHQDAYEVFTNHLSQATFYRLSASRLGVELLARLFPDGDGAAPRVSGARAQSYALNALAQAFLLSGEPGRAEPLYRRSADIDEHEQDARNLRVDLSNLAEARWPTGQLRQAETVARRAIGISRGQKDLFGEGVSLRLTSTALAAGGQGVESHRALRRALALAERQGDRQGEGVHSAYLCQHHLWLGRPADALPLAHRAWQLAGEKRFERDFIRAARIHGEVSLGLGDLSGGEERLQHALTRARAVNSVDEELPALTSLAELHRRRHEYDAARERLDDVWAPAERGPYVLWHADARNVLARLERDLGHRDAAVEAATQAYRLAWADGPPYAYHHGLTSARALLRELGAPEPELPPFDPAKFPPMPDVELNPRDEFYVEPKP